MVERKRPRFSVSPTSCKKLATSPSSAAGTVPVVKPADMQEESSASSVEAANVKIDRPQLPTEMESAHCDVVAPILTAGTVPVQKPVDMPVESSASSGKTANVKLKRPELPTEKESVHCDMEELMIKMQVGSSKSS